MINIAPGPLKPIGKELVKNFKKFQKELPTGKIGDLKKLVNL